MKHLLYLALLLLPLAALSQGKQDLWFHTLHDLPNFSPSYNYWVYHDSEGFVWISSTAGLNRFDGLRVKYYGSVSGDSTSMADDNIQSNFYEDRRKNLWFSTSSAINCYRRATDDFWHLPAEKLPSMPEDNHVFFLERDTFLWYQTEHGIYRYKIYSSPPEITEVVKTPTIWSAVDTLADGSVCNLYVLGPLGSINFKYWAIENGKMTAEREWFDRGDILIRPRKVTSIITQGGISWVGTEKGLVRWDREKKQWDLLEGENYPNCWLANWNEEQLVGWSKKKGLFNFNKKSGSFTPVVVQTLVSTDLTYQNYFNLYIDHEDNLWIPFFTSGLMYANLRKTKFKSLSKKINVHQKDINYAYLAFLEGENGEMWHGSSTAGLFLLNNAGEVLRNFVHEDTKPYSLPDNWVASLARGKDGTIWVGTRGGLAYMHPSRENDFITFTGNDDVFHVYPSKKGLLASINGKGIFKIDEENERQRLVKVLASEKTYDLIHEDRFGNIYLCNNGESIEILDFGEDTLIPKGKIPIEGYVSGIVEDSIENILWIGTFSGLAKVNIECQTVDTIFTEKDGLPNKNIHGILADDHNNLWLGTPASLVKFYPKTYEFKTFDRADGTRSSEYHFRGAMRLSNGELWFGGANGITIVPGSGDYAVVTNLPKLSLTNLEVNFQKQSAEFVRQRQFTLPYEKNTLAFEFVGMEYSDPANNQLGYFMEGVDKDTVFLEKGLPGTARYPNLRSGTYTLWLLGKNSDGIPTKPVKAVTVTINPHWTNTRWFYALVALTILASFYAYYRFRVAQIRKKEEMRRKEAEYKQKEAEFRQKEAEYKQLVAETETAVLRLQMNPHFIFNSMNSINSYILKKDIDTASEYLGRFAKLMRMILKHAEHKYIAVSDEIEMLELYLQTEAMRFERRFDYVFKIDDSLDPDETILPTMVLQPFVENAVWHGISKKEEGGLISINFQSQGGKLVCTVEDNGQGRQSSQAFKDPTAKHESKALSLTERRLKLLSQETGEVAHFDIVDRMDTDGNACGTQVVLTLPVL